MIFKNYLSLISVTDQGDSTNPQQFLILIQLFTRERERTMMKIAPFDV